MTLEYIRDCYKVPAYEGNRVRYCRTAEGMLTGADGPHVLVLLDGDTESLPYHPTHDIEYWLEGQWVGA
jgi:hypothetical protein